MLNFIILVAAIIIANLVTGVIGYFVAMRLMSSEWYWKKCYKMGTDMVDVFEAIEEEEEQKEEV